MISYFLRHNICDDGHNKDPFPTVIANVVTINFKFSTTYLLITRSTLLKRQNISFTRMEDAVATGNEAARLITQDRGNMRSRGKQMFVPLLMSLS